MVTTIAAERAIEAGGERGRLAEVATEANQLDARVALARCAHPLRGAVARAVVDEEDLERDAELDDHIGDPTRQLVDRASLVEDRHQHGEVELGRRGGDRRRVAGGRVLEQGHGVRGGSEPPRSSYQRPTPRPFAAAPARCSLTARHLATKVGARRWFH